MSRRRRPRSSPRNRPSPPDIRSDPPALGDPLAGHPAASALRSLALIGLIVILMVVLGLLFGWLKITDTLLSTLAQVDVGLLIALAALFGRPGKDEALQGWVNTG